MNPRPRQAVRLVNSAGEDTTLVDVDRAHTQPGMQHRAFSVVLHDGDGNILLQRRSSAKLRWPGYIANSCCGHPRSRESLLEDARTRVREELGIDVDTLREVGHVEYRAQMPDGQWVEWEYDHVLVGTYSAGVVYPDPLEVSQVYWVPASEWSEFTPISPWLDPVMRVAMSAIC